MLRISLVSIYICEYKVNIYNFSTDTPLDVRSGDTVFAVYSYVAETDEAINLVEGERLYILGIHTPSLTLLKGFLC